jgi:CopG antitoxin of type II toxin-antitoxin system
MGEHIPRFRSKEQEAEFWQKTGLEQIAPDQLEEVQVERPRRRLSTTFAVRFDERTIAMLRAVAKARGLGATQLVRAWVMERLGIERAVGALAEQQTDFPSDFELALRQRIVDALMENIPIAAEAAMQDVLDRADQERADLADSP